MRRASSRTAVRLRSSATQASKRRTCETCRVNSRVALVLALSITLLACCGGGIAFTFLRGRRAPSSGLTLIYACPEPVAASDAPLFESRLDDVDAWGSVELIDPSHLRVRVGADESSRDLSAAIRMT